MDDDILFQIKKCDLCKSDAVCLCFICKNYFCENCFKVIHDLNKNSNHKKVTIDPYTSIDLKCQKHPEYPLELFCTNEKGNTYKIILF